MFYYIHLRKGFTATTRTELEGAVYLMLGYEPVTESRFRAHMRARAREDERYERKALRLIKRYE